MASPLTIYVSPDEELGMEIIDDDDLFRQRLLSELDLEPHTYRLKDPYTEFHVIGSNRAREVIGKLSPTNKITVPKATRRKMGIPKKATHYAYAHPPEEFAKDIDWQKYELPANVNNKDTDDIFQDSPVDLNASISGRQLPRQRQRKHSEVDDNVVKNARGMFPVLGGYVYFDEDGNVLSVNILTFARTIYNKIFLTGPYETPPAVVNEMAASKRIGTIPFKQFHESSYVAMGWILPSERLTSEPLLENREHRHGAFIMVRYDNTAVTYTVEKDQFTDYDGGTGIIPDVYDSFYERQKHEVEFSPKFIKSNFVDSLLINEWRVYINAKIMSSARSSSQESSRSNLKRKSDFSETQEIVRGGLLEEDEMMGPTKVPLGMEGEMSLIHEAVRSGVSLENIQTLLKDPQEMKCLGEKDKSYGWNPLHYACAFSPRNIELIKLFIRYRPDSVTQCDEFGRYPLHIACDAGAPAAVIRVLLSGKGRGLVLKQTEYLKRLPLHIALNRDPDIDVISALLDADESGESIRGETSQGRRPLHVAIAMNASTGLVRLLLEADSNYASGGVDKHADILKAYAGQLPLHLASLHGCPKETVGLLLEKDVQLSTLHSKVKDAYGNISMVSLRHIESSFASRPTSPSSGKIALDIAIARRQEDIVRLLLQKELQKESRSIVMKLPDNNGRYALHTACRENLSPDIISKLLHLDPYGKAVCYPDDDSCMKPIHYACDHQHAQKEVVAMLLKAEKMSASETENGDKRNNLLDKSPLWFACRSNAPVEVLDLLMNQDNFNFQGFETMSMRHSLALMIQKNPVLQKRLNKRMAKRINFTILNLRLIVLLVLITVFYITTEKLAKGNVPNWCGITVYSCTAIQTCLVGAKLLKQRIHIYLLDLWSWFEISNIAFLWISTTFIGNGCKDGGDSCTTDSIVLLTTCLLLLLNILSFLRSTLYPFALFATGLLTIVKVLLPFITVSSLLLIGFTVTYRIRTNFLDYEDHPDCQENFGKCLLFVANSFFGGPDETSGWLDVFFGIMVVVILLNVVIAIVSNAWRDAKGLAATVFWKSRVNFLIENAIYNSKSFLLLDWIDNLKFVPISNQTPWYKEEPYKSVTRREHHDNPGDFFVKEEADKIEQARSLESILNWIRVAGKDSEPLLLTENKLLGATIKWAIGNAIYVIFIILGFPTLGIMWPVDFRERIISATESSEETNENELDRNIRSHCTCLPNDFREQVISILEEKGEEIRRKT